MSLYSVHIVFITQNMTRIEVEASSREEARNKVLNNLPACSVESVSAWPIREHRPNCEVGRIAVGLDSGFGALVV